MIKIWVAVHAASSRLRAARDPGANLLYRAGSPGSNPAGVSVYWREDSLSALIQLGARGASDRAAILLVEMSLASQPEELKSWLEMCWRLPSHRRELLQVRG